MDNEQFHRRMALFGGLMSYAMGNLNIRLIKRLAATPGFADELEAMAKEITREMKGAVPEGYSIEDEADAGAQASREFNKNIANFVAQLRGGPAAQG